MAGRRRRRWRRRDLRRIAVVVGALVLVGAAIGLFASLYKSSSPSPPPVAGIGDGAGGVGANNLNSAPSGSTSGSAGDASILQVFPKELTSKLGRDYHHLAGHTVLLTVTTSGSVSRLGYLVPTADSAQFGDSRNVSHGWTRSFVAHGPYGPYSAIFIQTDRAGTPVHCTVTVDGVQKDSQTISGEFGRGLCYG